MRYILIFWAIPMSFFWGWYYLSLNDIHMGTSFFSNQMHQLVFHIYGQVLGIDPSTIPALVARACIFDTALIFGILAFRRRKEIWSWWQSRKVQKVEVPERNLPNLSNAP
jgi:Family of unknown function (DUF6105)